jgi:hypothetical protein
VTGAIVSAVSRALAGMTAATMPAMMSGATTVMAGPAAVQAGPRTATAIVMMVVHNNRLSASVMTAAVQTVWRSMANAAFVKLFAVCFTQTACLPAVRSVPAMTAAATLHKRLHPLAVFLEGRSKLLLGQSTIAVLIDALKDLIGAHGQRMAVVLSCPLRLFRIVRKSRCCPETTDQGNARRAANHAKQSIMLSHHPGPFLMTFSTWTVAPQPPTWRRRNRCHRPIRVEPHNV